MRCAVLGAGSFGTGLAVHLAQNGYQTAMWERRPERCQAMRDQRRNPLHLSSVPFPDSLSVASDLEEVLAGAELVVPAVPSHALRSVLKTAAPFIPSGAVLSCATKGIEEGTLDIMYDVMAQELPNHERTMFSGPTFALEVAQGLPSAVVVAGPEPLASEIAEVWHGGSLRVYHTDDHIGVCVGASVKNVMAIGCGIADGLGLGLNARAALITRGLAEVTRLAVRMGANPATMMGLAGMGDLVLTCTGSLSRNRRVGLALGEGRTLESILAELGEVAEGVGTAKTAVDLAKRVGVEMPISEQVRAILHEGMSASDGLANLLGRSRKAE